ncbi:hypothetical protein Y1Q_0019195 [Alligator mississippiensis]|uniref:Uncharacterized protein n=1 Tax=Alligator mississippiensis TaxID=8496 RepID=A0A151MQB6_ALLMI|nr:hypothetical protein Y1Q_0019195 [Alligator mississippiensis]
MQRICEYLFSGGISARGQQKSSITEQQRSKELFLQWGWELKRIISPTNLASQPGAPSSSRCCCHLNPTPGWP